MAVSTLIDAVLLNTVNIPSILGQEIPGVLGASAVDYRSLIDNEVF